MPQHQHSVFCSLHFFIFFSFSLLLSSSFLLTKGEKKRAQTVIFFRISLSLRSPINFCLLLVWLNFTSMELLAFIYIYNFNFVFGGLNWMCHVNVVFDIVGHNLENSAGTENFGLIYLYLIQTFYRYIGKLIPQLEKKNAYMHSTFEATQWWFYWSAGQFQSKWQSRK